MRRRPPLPGDRIGRADGDRAAQPAFARLERLSVGRAGPAFVGAWALAEAIALPIIPDVALGLLTLVVPRRWLILFAGTVAGSLIGTALLYELAVAAPDAAANLLLTIPGIHPPMLDGARELVASGNPLSIATFGPGTPLKVFTVAWATGPGTPLAIAAGVVANRVTRIGPGLVLVTVLGSIAPDFLRRHDRLVLSLYAAFYLAVYALYLR